jgi:hypothetical protein
MANKNSMARDVFMYLLVIVVLGMAAGSLGALLFDMVNVYLPDPIRSVCAYDGCAGAVNTEVAILLISFPVLLWAWRFLKRDLATHPEKSDLWVRRWLLYLALFVSGIAAIIDLIALVTSWLNGELTLQFFLKILIVLVIASVVFKYFLRELHGKAGSQSRFLALFSVSCGPALVHLHLCAVARDRANDRDKLRAAEHQSKS